MVVLSWSGWRSWSGVGCQTATGVDAEGFEQFAAECGERRIGAVPRVLELDPSITAEAAAVEHEHAVGEHDRLVDVVGHEQHGGSVPAAQLAEQAVHLQPRERVERAERLVEQQQLRLAHERPGQCDALRLAARQGDGPGVGVARRARLRRAPRRRAAACGRCGGDRAARWLAPAATATAGAPGTRRSGRRGRAPIRRTPSRGHRALGAGCSCPCRCGPSRATNSLRSMSRSMSEKISRPSNDRPTPRAMTALMSPRIRAATRAAGVRAGGRTSPSPVRGSRRSRARAR